MIQLKNLCKSYDAGEKFAVNNVSLTIQSGEIIVLLGSSGSGKSTLLKMINGLIKPSSGEVLWDGKDIATKDPVSLRRSIGYVFQGVGLFPHMSVAENITIVLRLLKIPIEQRWQKARELLALVNLDPDVYSQRKVSELSGGQQQRVGVARALANNPLLLLMDEPFGALDSITRNHLQQELLKLNQQLKKTIVFVTHDISEAFKIANRIVVLDQGEIQQVGTKEDLLRKPANAFVKDLVFAGQRI